MPTYLQTRRKVGNHATALPDSGDRSAAFGTTSKPPPRVLFSTAVHSSFDLHLRPLRVPPDLRSALPYLTAPLSQALLAPGTDPYR